MNRRSFLASSAAFVAAPAFAETDIRFSITGAMEQGSLALGTAPPGSLVALDGRPLDVTQDGRFVFGFAYNQTTASQITVRYPEGGGDTRSFTPAKRQYDIQRINGLPQNMVTPPPEVQERISKESASIYLARFTKTAGTDFLSGFDWPAPGIESGVFGSQRIDNGTPMSPHMGVDMAAPVGTPIHAPADGIVTVSADHYVNGGFTLLAHGQGVGTCYLHQSKRLVKEGDSVKRGQVIGHIGRTGRATGPHLHWEMNWFQVKLDPSRATKKPKPDSL